jgi:hypothetical protein
MYGNRIMKSIKIVKKNKGEIRRIGKKEIRKKEG